MLMTTVALNFLSARKAFWEMGEDGGYERRQENDESQRAVGDADAKKEVRQDEP